MYSANACRVRRDILHRGRDVLQVLDQYEKTVKPSFESYILPSKKYADIIVSSVVIAAPCPSPCEAHIQLVLTLHMVVLQIPRGAENEIAIDLILQHIKFRLSNRLT